jgi:hypothetical protein
MRSKRIRGNYSGFTTRDYIEMTSAFEGASGLTRKRCARRDGPVAMRSASHLDVAGCSFILIDFSARPRTPFIGIPWLFLPLTCQE